MVHRPKVLDSVLLFVSVERDDGHDRKGMDLCLYMGPFVCRSNRTVWCMYGTLGLE